MFCRNCGTQLPDGTSFCSNCGTQLVAPGAAAHTTEVAVASKPTDKIKTYFKTVWEYIAAFFKRDPADTFNAAYIEKTPMWYAMIGGAFLLTFGCVMAMIQAFGNIEIADGVSINAALKATKEYYAKMSNAEREFYEAWLGEIPNVPGSLLGAVGFFSVLLFSLIIYVGTIGTKVLGTWICANKMAKNHVTMSAALNVISISELPMVAGCVLATLVSFVWYPLGLVCLLAGATISVAMHAEAIRATGMLGPKNVWMVAILNVVVNILFAILVYWAVSTWAEDFIKTSLGYVSEASNNFDRFNDLGDLADLLG